MSVATAAAFKAKARTLGTPSLLVLWDMLKADPQTSFALLLWTGAEYQRRLSVAADLVMNRIGTDVVGTGDPITASDGRIDVAAYLDGVPAAIVSEVGAIVSARLAEPMPNFGIVE